MIRWSILTRRSPDFPMSFATPREPIKLLWLTLGKLEIADKPARPGIHHAGRRFVSLLSRARSAALLEFLAAPAGAGIVATHLGAARRHGGRLWFSRLPRRCKMRLRRSGPRGRLRHVLKKLSFSASSIPTRRWPSHRRLLDSATSAHGRVRTCTVFTPDRNRHLGTRHRLSTPCGWTSEYVDRPAQGVSTPPQVD